MKNLDRLREIARIIEAVDERCLVADGPEMIQDEITEIYLLAKGAHDEGMQCMHKQKVSSEKKKWYAEIFRFMPGVHVNT